MPDNGERAWGAYLGLTIAVAGIAWSAIFVRWAAIPGPASAFYRVLIASAVLVPWRILHGGDRPRTFAAVLAFASGVFFAVDLALWNTSVLSTDAAVASLLGNNTPIFVGLLTWIFLRRQPGRRFWAGLLLALIGCGCIASADFVGGRAGHPHSLRGDVLAVVASVFFAGYLTTTERLSREMDRLTLNTLAITGSVLALAVVCLAMGMPLAGYSTRTWAALAGLGLISQLTAYFALVTTLGRLPATITSVALLAQVPCTALLAFLLLGEPLTRLQLTGGAIVLAGIVVVTGGKQS